MSWKVAGTDIETTGLDQEKGHRIIEASVGIWKTDDWRTFTQIGDIWTKRMNPERSIDAKAQEVHGISAADLAHEPPWEKVAPTFAKLLGSCDLVVAHNGDGFDFPFIGLELLRIEHPIPNFETFDTMLEGREATAMGRVPNLGALCWALDVDYDPALAHAAEYDVDRMMEAFFEGCRRGVFDPKLEDMPFEEVA